MNTKKIKLTKKIKGGITAAKGYVANGVVANIKASGSKDLGLIFSKNPCNAVGTFTTNKVRAACVNWNEKLLPAKNIHAIFCNSGNANACTGKQGILDVKTTAKETANIFGVKQESVLIAQTGIIGEFMPMKKVSNGLNKISDTLNKKNGVEFSEAILTTDTVKKEYAVKVTLSTGDIIIGGSAKGSGMIHPNMATMLGFVTSDAKISVPILDKMLKRVVDRTFNNLTVDGDTSTNDMVLLLANGDSNISVTTASDKKIFEDALFDVCNNLCAKIADDGEGATKRIEINVRGGKSFENCKLVAKSIANSNLVKTAMFGNDPNWGRILCAIGYSNAKFLDKKLTVSLCNTQVYKNGAPTKFDAKKVIEKMGKKSIDIDVELGYSDNSHAVAHTCDLTYDYIKINAEYHT